MRRWWQRPPLHFVALGTVLFAARAQLGETARPEPASPVVVIDAARIERVRAEFARDFGHAPSAEEEAALVAREIDDEVLYREALARGLDRGDRSIRWRLAEKLTLFGDESGRDERKLESDARALGLDRDDPVVRKLLVQKMRLLAVTADADDRPDEAALEEFMARHAAAYVQPARVSFRHVFLSAQARGDRLEADAERALGELTSDAMSPELDARPGSCPGDESEGDAHCDEGFAGDPFPFGAIQRGRSARELAALFGPEFAAAAMELVPGAWAGPLRSAYGVHLVRVDEIEPARLPPLAAVRSRVERALAAERREAAFREMLGRVRERYEVRVEAAAGAAPQVLGGGRGRAVAGGGAEPG